MKSLKSLITISVLLVCAFARADYYVATEAKGGSDSNDGSAEHPFLTIVKGVTEALKEAGAGTPSVVHVGEGEFALASQILLSDAVTVVGAGRDKTFVTGKSNMASTISKAHTSFALTHDDAMVKDLTIWKSTYESGNDSNGLGVYMTKGTVRGCTICGNKITGKNNSYRIYGAGIYMTGGLVDHCVISNNTIYGGGGNHGGGVHIEGGTIENTLIAANSSSSFNGGGVWATGGKLLNCTIAGNKGANGAGAYVDSGSPKFVNCLIGDNPKYAAKDGAVADFGCFAKYNKSNVSNCAIPGFEGGVSVATGATDVMALNVPGDYTVMASSSAIDIGDDTQVYATDFDLAGNPRKIGTVDAGCYEYDTSVYAVSFDADKAVLACGESVALTPTVRMPSSPTALTYAWRVENTTGVVSNYADKIVTTAFDRCGWYTVKLTVTDSVKGEKIWTRTNYLYVYNLTRYVATAAQGGDDGNDGQTADKPMASVEKAVASAIEAANYAHAAATVHVGAGEFLLNASVNLTGAVTVKGVGRDATFIAPNGTLGTAAFVLSSADAVVEEVTIWKGTYSGMDKNGVGVNMSAGTIRNCTICKNKASNWRCYGAGLYMTGGLVDHCFVTNNTLDVTGQRNGAGIYMTGGRVENSLIAGNYLQGDYTGGGIYTTGGTVLNCTIAGNKSGSASAGVYVAKNSPAFINCIIAGNLKTSVTPNVVSDIAVYSTYDKSLLDHCAIPDFVGGTATATGPVDLKDDYTVGASSSAIDAGRDDQTYASAGDLAGNDRKSGDHIDAGCYEYDTSGYAASFTISADTVMTGESVTLTPTVIGASDETKLTYAWTLTSDTGVTSNYTDKIVTTAFDIGGHYDISLVVTDPKKGEAPASKPSGLFVVSTTRYVATAEKGGDDANHGQSSDKPLLNISTAVAAVKEAVLQSGHDGYVHIGEGTFEVTGGMTLDRAIHVIGAGRDKTIIRSATANVKYRPFTLNHASSEVACLTIRDLDNDNGAAFIGGSVLIDTNGGLVRDCSFINNGGFAPFLRGSGAALHAGRLLRCIVTGCWTRNNTHPGAGVWMDGGIVESCLIVTNTTQYSGADVEGDGGGVYMSGGTLLNSTVANNTSVRKGGGVYATGASTRIVNCIIANNSAKTEGADVYFEDSVDADNVRNSYVGGLDFGTSPVLKDVDFVAVGQHLRASSRCIDAGTLDDVELAETDLDGRPRTDGGKVDLGCYQYDKSVFACGLKADNAQVFTEADFRLSSTVFGAPAGANLTYLWTVSDGKTVREYTTSEVNDAFSAPGSYTVTLVVTDTVSGQSTPVETRAGYLYIVSLDRYVAPNGSDDNDGLDAAHPFGSLSNAVLKIAEVAKNSGMHATLHLAAGTYVISNSLSLSSSVTVQGPGRDTAFVTGGPALTTAFYLTHDDAVLSGLTVTNIFATGYGRSGIGLYMTKGLVADCRVTHCVMSDGQWRGQGAGVYMKGGTVRDTIIENCLLPTSERYGCGVYMTGGTLERCLVRDNDLPKFMGHDAFGAGVYATGGKVLNCSIVGNSTERLGGGLYVAGASTVISNCLIAGNAATEDDGDLAPNVCLTESFNPDNLIGSYVGGLAEAFVDDDAVPLAGSPLIAAKIGWKTFSYAEPCVGFATDKTEALVGEKLTFTGAAYGATPGAYSWTIQPPTGAAIVAEGASFEKAFETPGVYAVTLTVGGVGSLTRETAFRIGPTEITLSDGDDLADAVTTAVDGTVITLGAGTYGLGTELVLDKQIDIVGAGRDVTTLCRTNRHNDAVDRAVRLVGGGTLKGLSITGGRINLYAGGYFGNGWYGAGLWVTGQGGTVEDCRLFANTVEGNNSQLGAGLALMSSKGRVTRTLIDGNRATVASASGAGVYLSGGRLDSCLILTNAANACGGVTFGKGGEMVNCTIVGNSSKSMAGGLYLGAAGTPTIHNNVLAGNTTEATDDFIGKPQWGARNDKDGNTPCYYYPYLTNAVKNCAFVASDWLGEGSFACEDALFRNPEAGDYRIRLESPCRFAGRYEGVWMDAATDYYGNRRVVGKKRVDIGYHQTPPNGMMLLVR